MRTKCPSCGKRPELRHRNSPKWWVCKCGCSFLKGPIYLADNVEIINGQIYSPMRDYESDRRLFYSLMEAHPESYAELARKIQQSRLRDPMPHMPARVERYDVVRSRKGSKLYVPNNYLPPRCMTMWKRGELSPTEVYAAAMYVYSVRTSFILQDVGTNFPQHEKVQSSVRPRMSPGRGTLSVALKPEIRLILDHCLIEERALTDVPGITSAKRTKRHREGKRLFRDALHQFSETANLPGIF